MCFVYFEYNTPKPGHVVASACTGVAGRLFWTLAFQVYLNNEQQRQYIRDHCPGMKRRWRTSVG